MSGASLTKSSGPILGHSCMVPTIKPVSSKMLPKLHYEKCFQLCFPNTFLLTFASFIWATCRTRARLSAHLPTPYYPRTHETQAPAAMANSTQGTSDAARPGRPPVPQNRRIGGAAKLAHRPKFVCLKNYRFNPTPVRIKKVGYTGELNLGEPEGLDLLFAPRGLRETRSGVSPENSTTMACRASLRLAGYDDPENKRRRPILRYEKWTRTALCRAACRPAGDARRYRGRREPVQFLGGLVEDAPAKVLGQPRKRLGR